MFNVRINTLIFQFQSSAIFGAVPPVLLVWQMLTQIDYSSAIKIYRVTKVDHHPMATTIKCSLIKPVCDFLSVINTDILSRTVSKLSHIIV